MTIHMKILASSIVTLMAMWAEQAAAADLERGELLFQTCSACHSILGDGLGPDLQGIYGKKAGRRPGFTYSPAMKAANLTWNAKTLRLFIRDPQKLVKGTTMLFPGYSKQADVDDVVAYLKQLE